MPRPTARQEIRACIAWVRRFGAPAVMGLSPEAFEAMVPHILRGAVMEDRERERKRRERMMAQTTRTTPSLIAQLYARDAAQAVDNRRAAGGRAYLAPLDNHARALGYPGGILAAIDAEVAELAGCDDKVRAASEAALKQHPDPPPGARRRVADAERALRNTALGALNVLDSNPALLSDWRQRITSIPDDAGPNHAEAHWLCIWPLLGRARGLLAVPAALDAQARALGVLVEAELAQGQPVEVPPGRGSLPETERPKARGS